MRKRRATRGTGPARRFLAGGVRAFLPFLAALPLLLRVSPCACLAGLGPPGCGSEAGPCAAHPSGRHAHGSHHAASGRADSGSRHEGPGRCCADGRCCCGSRAPDVLRVGPALSMSEGAGFAFDPPADASSASIPSVDPERGAVFFEEGRPPPRSHAALYLLNCTLLR